MYIPSMQVPCIVSSVVLSGHRRKKRIALCLFAILLGWSTFSCAQQSMGSGHDMADMQALVPPEQLPTPIHMTGIGNAHITIAATPEAQVWFDQGLNLLHDFWDYEAMKAFEQSIRVDPNCAMCWWGLAQAAGMGHSESAVYGKRAIAQAVKLEDHASETDKLYIEATQVDASSKEHSKRSANKKEIAILQELVRKAPADQQAHLYLALALMDGYNDKGEPKRGQQEGMAVLEGILRDTPNDSAANHYWIHAVEPGNHPEQAITSAALLASLAPNSGHMVHMPGHIYYRVGNYPVAEHWFAASMATDERYMQEQHVGPDDDWNYAHNMMYAIANMMEQGRLSDANTLSDHLAAARGHLSASLYIWSARDQVSRISHRLPVALRVGDWDAVLTMLNQAKISDTKKTANLRFLATGLTEYATGMKALESRNIAVAQSASAQLDADLARVKLEQAAKHKEDTESEKAKDGKEKKKEPPMVPISPDALSGPLVKCMAIQSLELRAGILLAEGKTREAKKLYSQAIKDEKKLGYHEPPFYIRPVAETEAAAFLQAKDFKAAQAAYEAALVERPNSGFGLYGLALSKELSGDATGARNAYQTFLKAWSNADPGLPEVARARKVLSTDTQAAR